MNNEDLRKINLFTKAYIKKQLDEFNIAKGKPVTIHSSLKAIGETEGGGEGLLSVLIDYFAKDGGIFSVPTHTWTSDVYDRRKAESCTGVLSKLAAAHSDAIRTLHPTHSLAVFGNDAADFASKDNNTDTPVNPGGCYGELLKRDGYILLVGVGHEKNTFIHCVEEMLNVPKRLTDYKVEKTIIHKDGREEKRHIKWFYEEEIPDVSVYFKKFEPAFRYHSCITDGFIGNAKAQLISTVKIKEIIELIYKNSEGRELLSDNTPLPENLYKI